MAKTLATALLATLTAFLLPVPSFSEEISSWKPSESVEGIDYPAFLGQCDMFWDNNITPDPVFPAGAGHKRHWGRSDGYYAGALMGNGLLGTNLYKLTDSVYRLNVGRSDVTEARQPFSLTNSARLPIGYFTFSTVGKVRDEKMRLSIYDAETSGCLQTDRGELKFRTYVHSLMDCIVFETSAEGDEKDFGWDFVPQQAVSPRCVFNPDSAPAGYLDSDGKSNPDPYRVDDGDCHFLVQQLASDTTFTRIVSCYVVGWKQVREGNTSRIIATVSRESTAAKALSEAKSLLRKACSKSSASLESSHREWWHGFYRDAAFLTFPDKRIESFYWFQYYKFASTARPGKPVVDLQGVWPTCDTPWPAIWMNLNIQLTYSWLTKANLGFLEQPLWDAFWKNRDNLTRNVTDIPGQEDWTECRVLPRASSYDFLCPLDPALVSCNQYEVGNLTWTLFYFRQMCEAYGDDRQMKTRLFPLLKSAVNIFFRLRTVNPDGTYSLPSTASPEYGEGELGEIGTNSNYDLANLRWGLQTLIEIDGKYGLNDPMLPQWKDFLAKLTSFRYDGKTGFKVSDRFEFLDTTHRHWSHLFMIYPYHLLSWDNPREAEMMNLSVDRWQGNTGYSLTVKAAMLASRGDGDAALALLQKFLSGWVRPNTLYNESGPVIETPFSAMCSLEELYMQDWGDRIRVFNGCPSSWTDVSFRNMRARGAFLISAVRRGGSTAEVKVYSERGGICRIQTGIPEGRLIISDGEGHTPQWKSLGGGVIEIQTKKGTTVTLTRSSSTLPIIPYPESVVIGKGTFDAEGAEVICHLQDAKEAAAVDGFAANLRAISSKQGKNKIIFGTDSSLAEESYRIVVENRSIEVFSSSYSGTFYAIRTLQQLLPPGIYGPGIRKALSPEGRNRHFAPGSEHAAVTDAVLVRCGEELKVGSPDGGFLIPCAVIEDAPRFSYRGAGLDCSRHFFTVESVKNFLRVMSFYKMNRFHWHLTNDAGWRAEIKKYPRLTEEGAFRNGIMTSHVKGLYRGGRYGGYYTQDDMREIVRYADSLAITVVPEICLPSHIESALVAYPYLGCTGGPYQLRNKIGVYPEILCAGKESSYEFIDDVLGELCEIFPGEYFHIGGDECLKTRWEECSYCQAKIKELGFEDDGEWKAENYLQNYLTHRVQNMLAKRGKKLIGWDEIIEGDLAPGATVMSWRGTSGGIKAVSKGMEVVMAPTSHCYLDYIQSDMPDIEPPSIGYYLPFPDVYDFNPTDGIAPENQHLVKGVECELWTEFIVTENHLHYMMLPRLLAVSEVQWCAPESRDEERIRHAISSTHFPLLRSQGYIYCRYGF